MRRFIWPSVALALVILYPLLFTTPFQQRLGALILLYAIAASAWNIIGGYAGQVSVGHVVFFGCGAYASMAAYAHFGLPPLVGIPVGIAAAVLIAAVIGVPTLRLSGHYFSMATIAVAELAFARFNLVENKGHSFVYSRRFYGEKSRQEADAWLAANGDEVEKALMNWEPPAIGK